MRNLVINEDSLTALERVPPDSVDLVVIDPPYCSENKARAGTRYNQNQGQLTQFDDMSARTYTKFMHSRLRLLFQTMKAGAHIYVFCGWKLLRELMDTMELSSFRLNKVLIWDQMSIGGGYAWRNQHEFIVFGSKGVANPVQDKSYATVLSHPRIKEGVHPFQKPTGLIADIIRNASKEGDLVLDCFGGSGTVAVVAKSLKRDFISIEIDSDSCSLTNQRLVTDQALDIKRSRIKKKNKKEE